MRFWIAIQYYAGRVSAYGPFGDSVEATDWSNSAKAAGYVGAFEVQPIVDAYPVRPRHTVPELTLTAEERRLAAMACNAIAALTPRRGQKSDQAETYRALADKLDG